MQTRFGAAYLLNYAQSLAFREFIGWARDHAELEAQQTHPRTWPVQAQEQKHALMDTYLSDLVGQDLGKNLKTYVRVNMRDLAQGGHIVLFTKQDATRYWERYSAAIEQQDWDRRGRLRIGKVVKAQIREAKAAGRFHYVV
jgi:hypothetical protein